MTPDDQGFSLIESLVAMAVLAVGAGALIQASQTHVDTVRALEARAAAQWVAENRLIELGLARTTPEEGSSRVTMLDRDWAVAVRLRPNEDPDLSAVEVSVGEPNGRPALANLKGFVDIGSAPPPINSPPQAAPSA